MSNAVATYALDRQKTLHPEQLRQFTKIRPVSEAEQEDEFYTKHTFVPAGELITVTESIIYGRPPVPHHAVGLFNLTEPLLSEIENWRQQIGRMPARNLMSQAITNELTGLVRAHVLQRFPLTTPDLKLDLGGYNYPNLQTVTIDRVRGYKTGLHLDSWYGNTLRHRTADLLRILVNFGPAPRWFLYVPTSIERLGSLLKASKPDWTEDSPISHWDLEMDQLGLVVNCLRIDPGQGYVAPTEAILHDATTRWTDEYSLNIQLLGDFNLHSLAKAEQK